MPYDAVPLIPREVLFGNPRRVSPRLSPDGRQLAYLAPDEKNVLQVWVRTVGGEDDRVLTRDRKRGIRHFLWAFDGEHLLYVQDRDGDEDWHVYAVNLQNGVVRDLTPFEGIQAQLIAVDPDLPHELLVGLNVRDRRRHDAYRVSLKNGAVDLDCENPGSIVGWTPDAQLQLRAALSATPDGGLDVLVRDAVEDPWRTLRHWGPEDEGHTIAFSTLGNRLYYSGSHDANARRLLVVDLETNEETVLAEDPEYDLGGFFCHPTLRVIQAAAFYRDRLSWQVLDESIAADFEALRELHSGDFQVVSRDLEDRTWLVAFTTDDGPIYFYTYDRAGRKGELLFTSHPELEGATLAPMQPVTFPARDGLTLHGYLTTPAGMDPDRLPTVLLVHGGPWARDVWGFHSWVQWLANRGYAVLQVNYRGSSGYGKAYLHAGDREWAGKMHDDLIDAVEWLKQWGTSDPAKIAIMGGSYGGYATLVGLTFTPDVFAAGVDLVGPSSLITLIQTIPPYWEPLMAMFQKRVGNLAEEEEFLRSRSPLFFTDRIRKPLLIAQGANDPRVKESESEQIVQAMREHGKPVEYLLYTDEGHGLARPENRLHFHARAEEFLARYLGGRAEPVGEIAGHSGEER